MRNFKNLRTMFLAFLMLFSIWSFGQKKIPLNPSVYDSWKALRNYQISEDGAWISYEINPQVGDGTIYLYQVSTGNLDSIPRGTQGKFAPGTDYFVFKIKPPYAVTRAAKKAKKKPDAMPKDSLGIFLLSSKKLTKISKVKSFQVPAEEGVWFAYQMEKIFPEKPVNEKKKGEMTESEKEHAKTESEKFKKESKKVKKAKGTDLFILNPLTGKKFVFNDVIKYLVSDKGGLVGIMVQTKDSLDHTKVLAFDTKRETKTGIWSADGKGKSLTLDKAGTQLAFIFTGDTAKRKLYNLVYWKNDLKSANVVVDSTTTGMPDGWSVSEFGKMRFSDSGNRLFFGTSPKPEIEKEDTLLKEEKYSLDIWSWTDPLMQPMQKLQVKRERERNYLATWFPKSGKMIQVGNQEIPDVRTLEKGDGNYAMGTSGLPYRKLISWEANRYKDVYLIDITTGKSDLLLRKAPSSVSLSPHGKFLLWYATRDSAWYCQTIETGKIHNLTGNIPYAFYNELHDTPSDPRPYGTASWVGNDESILIYDAFDIWKLDPTGKTKPVNLTGGFGRRRQVRFRYVQLDREEETLSPKAQMLLSAFHIYSKRAGFFSLNLKKPGTPRKLLMGDFSYYPPTKAKKADLLIWRKSSFQVYPDLWVSDLAFEGAKKISVTNPQQSKYLWGTVELVDWTAYDKQHLQGLLYKPENFDPNKKYPMIVYFYERSSDGIHRHSVPAPWRSTINRSYMVSNGYLVFVPDIPYKVGYPGESAFNAVVSGTMSLIEKYPFIDKDHMGLNGHSWGGYQIAYLVTRTNLYAAAYCGAPVSNMTSAYGGIRWGSGMSREFQYEQTQSRIGGTLWEKPLLYIENSPIFFVPKIQTPIMYIHNDNDGAVPWYQGIEFFSALRRLNKPAWMLVYNKEGHGLSKRPDMKDLTIREMQFYDHFLKGKPAPAWMVNGRPAIDKGKKDAYELVKPSSLKRLNK